MGESFSRFVLSGQVLRPYLNERRNRWLTGTGLVWHGMLCDLFRWLRPLPLAYENWNWSPDPDSRNLELVA